MGAVIELLPAAKPKRKSRAKKPVDVVTQAHRELQMIGGGVLSRENFRKFPILNELRSTAKAARPRAKSILCNGVRWPLVDSLWGRFVICPRSGRRLLGVVDL